MLTITTLQGDWRVATIANIGSAALGSVTRNLSWTVLMPWTGTSQVSQIWGSLNDSALSKYKTRDCFHNNLFGSILYTKSKFSTTVEDCTGTGWIGPKPLMQVFTFRTEKRTPSVAAGHMTVGLIPWSETIPDHSVVTSKGTVYYKDITVTGEVKGTSVRISCQYWKKNYDSSNFVRETPATDWTEIRKGPTTWRAYTSSTSYFAFNTLADQSSETNPFPSRRLSSREWTTIFKRLSTAFVGSNLHSDEEMFGDLVRRCANDAVTLDINNLEYLSDLRNTVTEIKDILALLRGKPSLKKAASLYLSYKYGVRLTVADTIQNYKALTRDYVLRPRYNRVRARERVVCTSDTLLNVVREDLYNYTIFFDPLDKGLRAILNRMYNTGLFPSLQNSWDLIPLSFVVDWFSEIGDSLTKYDSTTFWSLNQIYYAIQSKKTSYSRVDSGVIFPSLSGSAGLVTVSKYIRILTPTLVSPYFYTDTPRTFTNYAEASALLISRKRHK